MAVKLLPVTCHMFMKIIKPSLTFDPYSIESISNAILKAIETDNLPRNKGFS